MLLAIDCEFVSYAPAEKEVHEDGTEVRRLPFRPSLRTRVGEIG
jgi:hypothetical protein